LILGAGGPFCPWSHSRLRITEGSAYQRFAGSGESYHKLVRAVAYANGGKLRVRTDQEQQLWSECSRLLANCIIYYNACILSELLERAERRQDYQRADAIKRANPASWKHVNLYGAYQLPGYRRWGRPPGIGQSLGGSPR
jgi:hypothetical protein